MADFTWGAGGSQMTPASIAAQRKVAEALMAHGMDASPVRHWTQGLARVAQAALGSWDNYRADKAEQANQASDKETIAGLLAGSGAASPTATQPTTLPQPAPLDIKPTLPPVDNTVPIGQSRVDEPVQTAGLSDAIAKVSAARGVDPAYMTRLASVESGGNVNAANPNSSARGPFQFINSTAKQYGLANPNDPAASSDAAARLTLDNKAALTQALGREPTQGELYLAHQQGAGGAAKILANPNAPIESIVGPEAARLNGATPGMTAGQFAQKWTSRFPGNDPAMPAGAPVPAAAAQTAQAPANAAGGLQGVNPALLQAITSPYASDGVKKIAGLILQHQMAGDAVTTVDLGNEIGVMDKRGNVIRRMPKGEPNKGPTFGVIGEDAFGGKTHGWINPRDQSVKPYNAPADATQPGQAGTQPGLPPIISLDGKPIQYPQGVDPKQFRKTASEDLANAASGKLTEVQANATQFANRMEDAEKNIAKHQEAVAGYGGAYNRAAESLPFSSAFQSKEYQQFNQARSQFITALLRKESGAAINKDEFVRYDKEFFPQPGDGKEVIQQKANARAVALDAMKKGAGPSYKPPAATGAVGESPAGVDAKVWAAMTPAERALWK